MKTRILTTTIALCLLLVVHLRAQSASPFSVTGSDPSVPEISIQQNYSGSSTKRGDLTFAYKYNSPTTTGQAFLEISNPKGEWSWRKNADGTTPVEQMWLGDDGTLKVSGNFNGSPSGSITLNPYGQSITLTSVSGQTQTVLTSNGGTVNGSLYANGLYAQYNAGWSLVQPVAYNDNRYLSLSSSTPVSLAVGSGSQATANAMNFAFGTGAQAFGTANLAFGTNARTITNTSNALALGYNAYASNNNTIAIGYNASAMATGATALGYYNYATGDYSTAME